MYSLGMLEALWIIPDIHVLILLDGSRMTMLLPLAHLKLHCSITFILAHKYCLKFLCCHFRSPVIFDISCPNFIRAQICVCSCINVVYGLSKRNSKKMFKMQDFGVNEARSSLCVEQKSFHK